MVFDEPAFCEVCEYNYQLWASLRDIRCIFSVFAGLIFAVFRLHLRSAL